jgi:AcrR family transcriptional regulator
MSTSPVPTTVAGMAEVATANRGARRRARTRARLIEAARLLFSRQGVDATRINEITEQADVGFGSFYNHFASKDEIVEAVLAETVEAQGAAVEALTRGLDDPAAVVAVAHRYFVDLARSNPDWAWLLVRLDISHQVTLRALGPFAERDLRRGLESKRFDVPDRAIALHASGGALLAVMRAVLDGSGGPDAGIHHAAGVLRMLGVDPVDASEVANRPLPPRGDGV